MSTFCYILGCHALVFELDVKSCNFKGNQDYEWKSAGASCETSKLGPTISKAPVTVSPIHGCHSWVPCVLTVLRSSYGTVSEGTSACKLNRLRFVFCFAGEYRLKISLSSPAGTAVDCPLLEYVGHPQASTTSVCGSHLSPHLCDQAIEDAPSHSLQTIVWYTVRTVAKSEPMPTV